jgi:hypothetical protein
VLAALHPDLAEVRFSDPMTAAETRLYVETHLEQGGVPADLRARFDEETLGRIHRLSGGVPRRVHDLAGSLLRQSPEGVGRAWKEERWLGAPLGDGDPSDAGGEVTDFGGADESGGHEMPDLLLDGDDELL